MIIGKKGAPRGERKKRWDLSFLSKGSPVKSTGDRRTGPEPKGIITGDRLGPGDLADVCM